MSVAIGINYSSVPKDLSHRTFKDKTHRSTPMDSQVSCNNNAFEKVTVESAVP